MARGSDESCQILKIKKGGSWDSRGLQRQQNTKSRTTIKKHKKRLRHCLMSYPIVGADDALQKPSLRLYQNIRVAAACTAIDVVKSRRFAADMRPQEHAADPGDAE